MQGWLGVFSPDGVLFQDLFTIEECGGQKDLAHVGQLSSRSVAEVREVD